jgi:hypothetical protein
MSLDRHRSRDTGVVVAAIATIATAAAASHAGGCGFYCTNLGWVEGLTIRLTPEPGALDDGLYRFEIVADGEPIAIAVDVAGNEVTCADPDSSCLVEHVRDDGRRLWLRFDFDRLVVSYGNDGGPAEANVTVRHDGAIVATQTFTPRYSRSEPNGAGCGEATQATVDLAL